MITEQRDMFGARVGEYEVSAYAETGVCRSCDAKIAWVHTSRSRFMPLSVATIEERNGVRYALSHFADCPDAKKWSKR